jgi:ankyrin repeat protein
MSDISREEFHETVEGFLLSFRAIKNARKMNKGPVIVFPPAPGKLKEYWRNKITNLGDHKTYFQSVIDHHNEDLLRELILNGVNPCCKINQRGETLLHYAVYKGDLQKVKFILEHASRRGINAVDEKGRTALFMSINVPNYFSTVLIAKMLLSKGAEVNCADLCRRTPLHLACAVGELSLIEELLNHGAKLDVIDNDDRVPLQLCKNVSS